MELSRSKKTFGTAFSFASWWVCILGATYLPGNIQAVFFIFFSITSVLIHYFWALKEWRQFWIIYSASLILGLSGDCLLFQFGFLQSTSEQSLYLPYWLIAMWVVFPLNFGHAFRKIIEAPLYALPFGVIGAPLAYKAGPSFGILSLEENALIAVSLFWAVYMLAVSFLFKKINYSTKTI